MSVLEAVLFDLDDTLVDQRSAAADAVTAWAAQHGDDDAVDAVFEGYLRRYEAGWVRYDDAIPALRRARGAGLVVAVLTNGDAEQQHVKLRRVGLAAEVDVVVASSELSAGKPDPRAFAEALSRVGAPAHGTLMVGDSLTNDVRGAQAAGLRAVLLDRRGEHPDADVPRISSLDELDLA